MIATERGRRTTCGGVAWCVAACAAEAWKQRRVAGSASLPVPPRDARESLASVGIIKTLLCESGEGECVQRLRASRLRGRGSDGDGAHRTLSPKGARAHRARCVRVYAYALPPYRYKKSTHPHCHSRTAFLLYLC